MVHRDAKGGSATLAVPYIHDGINVPSLREGMPPAACSGAPLRQGAIGEGGSGGAPLTWSVLGED